MPIESKRLPVHTLTGFLGSGKSTLLSRLLRDPELSNSAVIVNELGEIGIDHALVETAFENAVLMRSGCLCCTLRGDLVDTLCDLNVRVTSGSLPGFERVLVETTGLADPGPILQTLMGEPLLTKHYAAGQVITTVDALLAPLQHDNSSEFARQVAVADHIVLTKTDLASKSERARAVAVVGRINPGAQLLEVVSGSVDPKRLLGGAHSAGDARTEGLARWTALEDAKQDRGVHGDNVRAYSVFCDEPVPWPRLCHWLESIVSLRGDRILRIKGIVNVAGESCPSVVHGVQHVLHPPIRLPRWPDSDQRTRIVFITRGLKLTDLECALRTACALPKAEH